MAFACPHCSVEIPDVLTAEEVEQQKAALVASHAAELAPLQAQAQRLAEVEQGRARLELERDVARKGIVDPEGIEVVGALYAALPADARPPSVAEWLASDTLPRGVRAYLPQPPAAAAPPAPAGAPPAPPAPAAAPAKVAAPVQPGAVSAAGAPTAEQIAAMPLHEYRALVTSMGGTAALLKAARAQS
jgi:hypothetical protein